MVDQNTLLLSATNSLKDAVIETILCFTWSSNEAIRIEGKQLFKLLFARQFSIVLHSVGVGSLDGELEHLSANKHVELCVYSIILREKLRAIRKTRE